jgi:hypothetical protein
MTIYGGELGVLSVPDPYPHEWNTGKKRVLCPYLVMKERARRCTDLYLYFQQKLALKCSSLCTFLYKLGYKWNSQ